ncbi:hypothetical protein C0992_001257 [Termitomyces sp. T32_za158]|nr:hypothetical protein C0992_001257 [Termitomyces sp. T32_za158]
MVSSQGVLCAAESTPLLQREGNEDEFTSKREGTSTYEMFWEEFRMLPQYTLPVLGAQWLEYSMVMVNIISIGHLSTTALAAVSLGTLTAGVTGFSMLHGLASGLDTVLPAAFTSAQPQLVGLWTQRMVWGPRSVRLGFIGAPIATAISYYIISFASYVYGRYLVPRTAWHPLSMRMFDDLGILVRLGLSGVGAIFCLIHSRN